MNAKGSCKLGTYCTSHIKIIQSKTNQIICRYVSTHSHSIELKHLKLDKSNELELANKLDIGIDKSNVLKEAKSSDDLKMNLINNTVLRNIQNKYVIERFKKRDQNEIQSLLMAIQEFKKGIIYFKNQNELDKEQSEFAKEDFILCYMVKDHFLKAQEFMKQSNGVIFSDATHGLNRIDFKLITLMTYDYNHHGFPFGFCISNRETYGIFKIFFRSIKEKYGHLDAKYCLTDDIEQVYSAWCSVFNSSTIKLLCSFHVDRNFTSNIIANVKNSEDLKEINSELFLIRHELDKGKLLVKINDFEKKWFSKYKKLVNFFKKNYFSRIEQWSYAFRKHTGINTNDPLESMHKDLKYNYLNNKMTTRIDEMFEACVNYLDDRYLKFLTNEIKPYVNKWQTTTFQNHQEALKTDKESYLIEFLNNEFILTKGEKKFIIKQNNLDHNHKCKLECNYCSKCVHQLLCSCEDNCIRTTFCIHLHLVHIFSKNDVIINQLSQQSSQQSSPQSSPQSMPDLCEENFVCEINKMKPAKISLEEEKEKFNKNINSLNFLINRTEDENLVRQANLSISHLIKNTMNRTSLKKFSSLNNTQSYSLRRTFANQIRFKSTKKKEQKKILLKNNKEIQNELFICFFIFNQISEYVKKLKYDFEF